MADFLSKLQVVKSRPALTFGAVIALWISSPPHLAAGPSPVSGPRPQAPPTAPPIHHLDTPPLPAGPGPKPLGVTPYSIGQPTDEEQLYLEYLNRMRANPTAEGQRLAVSTDPNVLAAYSQFGVNLSLMQSEFATNPPVPPLAMNADLIAAARWHSGDMFTNQYQGHYQTNGTMVLDPGQRMAANSYQAFAWGENVFSYSHNVPFGHAGFAVDWGGSPLTGGMQNPPGHRDNMLSADFREVGVGVVDGVNGSVGPQLVTQDFGSQGSATAFITGVVYYDFNGNGFYDLGEGIGGVTVNTPGSTYYAVTANSGGYAIPVSANGNYPLTFTAPGMSNQASVAVSSLHNVKVDQVLSYSPPALSGPQPAVLNQANTYTFTPVPGATAYQWLQAALAPFTLLEGAETGLGNVTVVSSPGYSVITTDRAASGTHSFNLVHAQATDQIITLNPLLLVSATSQLSFAEMLSYALANEVAKAQISADGGQTWQTLWSKPGNDGSVPVDSSFLNQSISLSAYSGQVVQVRFVYAFSSGSYFPGPTGVGLYLDNIAVSNAQQVTGSVTNNVSSGTSFSFTPTAITNYLLAVRPQIGTRTLAWGPAVQVGVAVAAPLIQLVSQPVVSSGQVQIDFTVGNYKPGMTFQLLKSSDLQMTWTADSSAKLDILVANSKFRFTSSSGGAQRLFFKVKSN